MLNSKKGVKCTTGSNGKNYYFKDGKRISKKKAMAINPNVKCYTKSSKLNTPSPKKSVKKPSIVIKSKEDISKKGVKCTI